MVPPPLEFLRYKEKYISSNKVGTRFPIKNILMALTSTKPSMIGKKSKPQTSKTKMASKVSTQPA